MNRNLERHPVVGTNPMRHWWRYVGFLRTMRNTLFIWIARYIPFTGVKNALLRLLGAKVGPNTAVGLLATFDVFFPELITIGDNSVIGYNCTLLTHEFLVREWRKGPLFIGNNVLIGANTTLLAGITVGDNAVVGAGSVVTHDVPAGSFVAGVPARPVMRTRRERIHSANAHTTD